MRRCFYDIYERFGVFAAVRNVVFPTSLQGDEKMKPIFSTEQARYQKFASFFIDVTGVSRVATRGYFALCGARQGLRPLTPPPFEKGGRKLSRLGSAVGVCRSVTLGSAVYVCVSVTLGSAVGFYSVFQSSKPP